MKKSLLLLTAISLLSANAFAYDVHKVGQFQVSAYNEILKKNLKHNASIWAGVDNKGKRVVELHVETALKTIKSNMYFDGSPFNSLLNSVNKTIEWHEVAKTNNASIKKKFGGMFECSTGLADCHTSFESFNNGQNAIMWLYFEDTNNQFYKIHGQVTMNNITLLKEIFDNLLPAKFVDIETQLASVPENVEDLFN